MNIQKHYESVEKFNDIAGNLNNVNVASIEAQMKVVVEEVKELQDAFDSQNALELLDGACDAFVTLSGLLQQMQRAGFDIDTALKLVNENNLSKYPPTVSIPAAASYFENKWTVVYNKTYDCYVLKDGNGKIRKPIGFQPVDIVDCLPSDFFGVAV